MQSESEVDPTTLSEETHAAAELLLNVQSTLEMMDASRAETKARQVLLGLGFKENQVEKPVSELSGGWKTRCDLACALCQYADVLLLDEPTNFLDLPSIIWLQDYIGSLKDTTVLITTHDRDFGDAVAEELIVLRHQTLETFRGNLSLYERERYKKARYLTKMKDAQEKQKKHMEKTVANNIKAAREKGDDKKLKQAASRKKKLDERMGMEVGLKGGRFKLNRDLGGYHLSNRAEIDIPDFDPPVKMAFPRQPPDLRFPGSIVSMEKVCFAYPGRQKTPVLNDISLTIQAGQRIGLAGLNGSGKTTLVSLMVGSSEEGIGGLVPTSGTISRHPRAKFGRFSQQSVEELSAIAVANPQLTALSHVREHCGADMDEKEARQLLSGLGVQGQTASEVPLLVLSGGQKVRVALAKLLFPPPQLLILDEVTTHLDADSILGLTLALREYDGALVVITHDRYFMRYVRQKDTQARRGVHWLTGGVQDGGRGQQPLPISARGAGGGRGGGQLVGGRTRGGGGHGIPGIWRAAAWARGWHGALRGDCVADGCKAGQGVRVMVPMCGGGCPVGVSQGALRWLCLSGGWKRSRTSWGQPARPPAAMPARRRH